MRVVLVVPAYYPATDFGGPLPTVRSLAVHLLGSGHEVQILTADFGPGRTRIAQRSALVDGVPVQYSRRIWSFRWAPVVPHAMAVIPRFRPDVVHCFGIRDGLTMPAAFGAALHRIPFVIEPMGMAIARISNVRLKTIFDRLLGNPLLARSQGLIATSPLEVVELRSIGFGARVWLRPNPVERLPGRPTDDAIKTCRERLGIAPDEFVASYIGRLHRKKGLDLMVRAAVLLPSVRVVVAGPDGRDGTAQHLRGLIDSLHLSDQVSLLPAVWGSDRDDLMAASDVFVVPSHSENFGNAAAEAASLGIPVVVTSRCGIADYVEQAGCGVVVPDDAEAIARAIERFRINAGLRAEMGRGGPRLADLLDPGRLARLQEQIYVEAIAP